jgi:hypothetical protein
LRRAEPSPSPICPVTVTPLARPPSKQAPPSPVSYDKQGSPRSATKSSSSTPSLRSAYSPRDPNPHTPLPLDHVGNRFEWQGSYGTCVLDDDRVGATSPPLPRASGSGPSTPPLRVVRPSTLPRAARVAAVGRPRASHRPDVSQ